MQKKEEKFFISRHGHTERDVSNWDKDYPGLNKKGIETARKRAQDLIKEIESLPKEGITWLAGCSEVLRTRSTLSVYGEELKKYYAEDEDILYLEKKDIIGKSKEVIDLIKNTKDKKIIINFPLALKEISNREMLNNLYEGTWDKEIKQLFLDSDKDLNKFTEDWFGKFEDKDGNAPKSPQKSYEQIVKSLKRLREFFNKVVSDRDSLIAIVGHNTELNSLATKLISGEISKKAFKEDIKDSIEETESMVINNKEGETKFKYRNKEYKVAEFI